MPTPETPTRSFNVWSFCRTLLSQGMAIQQDYETGKYRTYEEVSARLDEAAREREAEAAAWNARQLDPATLALARLGAVFAQAELDGHANLEKVRIALYATHNTPGIRERVAELLDTEALRKRRGAE
jgi:hypothetical protein